MGTHVSSHGLRTRGGEGRFVPADPTPPVSASVSRVRDVTGSRLQTVQQREVCGACVAVHGGREQQWPWGPLDLASTPGDGRTPSLSGGQLLALPGSQSRVTAARLSRQGDAWRGEGQQKLAEPLAHVGDPGKRERGARQRPCSPRMAVTSPVLLALSSAVAHTGAQWTGSLKHKLRGKPSGFQVVVPGRGVIADFYVID